MLFRSLRRKQASQQNLVETGSIEGVRPVCEHELALEGTPSRTSHVEPGLNLGGPSPKAKYSLATDSVQVTRVKGGKNPCEGRKLNLKPYAYKRSEPYVARQGDGVPFA